MTSVAHVWGAGAACEETERTLLNRAGRACGSWQPSVACSRAGVVSTCLVGSRAEVEGESRATVQARVFFLEGFYLMCDPKAGLCPKGLLASSCGPVEPCFPWVEVL